MQTAVYRVKSQSLEESQLQSFFRVKTVSGKVVRHSFASLSVYKWLAGDVLLYAKIWLILTHPLQNTDFQPIFARAPQP